MIYFAPASSPAIRDAMRAGRLGMITTPNEGRSPAPYPLWCADNGCFGDAYVGDEAWLRWLAGHAAHADRCLFATAPDVVGDAQATLTRSRPHLAAIRALGYRAALVAQNGLEDLPVPWDEFDVLFIGGVLECADHGPTLVPVRTGRPAGARGGARIRHWCPTCSAELSEWKLGAAAAGLVRAARERGKDVHMGRVNGRARIQYASAIGCASVDGTTLAFGPDRNLPTLLGWLSQGELEFTA